MKKRVSEAIPISSTNYLGKQFNPSDEDIVMVTYDGEILDANSVFSTKVQKSLNEIRGTEYRSYFPDYIAAVRQRYVQAVFEHGVPIHNVDTIGISWHDCVFAPIFKGPAVIAVTIFSRDITTQKRVESELHEACKQQKFLLQETNHRFKNNLQLIISMLSLQQYYLKNIKPDDMLNSLKLRIRTISRIHEKMDPSADFFRVDIFDCIGDIVRELTTALVKDKNRISLHLSGKRRRLSIDKAIPCGLLFNELISNSLKHGFDEKRRNTISINLDLNTDGSIKEIIYEDDGIGFDNEERPGFGTLLIKGLANQLRLITRFASEPGKGSFYHFLPDSSKSR